MSDISKINVGGTEYDIKDATARTETQPISRGGTGATTAADALSNLGGIAKSGDTNIGNLFFSQYSYPRSQGVYTPSAKRICYCDDSNAYFAESSMTTYIAGYSISLTGVSGTTISYKYDSGFGIAFYPESDNYLHLGKTSKRWYKVYSTNGVATGSDRRLKENISADFSKLANVFAKLRPVTFEYADQKDGLTRIGFIAQEIETAMTEEGLNAEDYAFLSKDTIDAESDMAKFIGDTTVYSLNYSEFIALNTYMIQQQQNKIDDLETRLSALEARLSNGDSN